MAASVKRFYGGDRRSVPAEEWARCWRLFGPSVIGDQERARAIVNRDLNAPGLELMRRFDVRDQLARIDCPTLVCVGALDAITPVAAAREIIDSLPDDIVQFEVIDGAGHFPWKDVPDRYWPLITEFVATATVTRAGSKPMARG